MLKRMNISAKVLLIGLVMIIAFTMVLTWVYSKYSSSVYAEKELKTQHVVDSALGVLDYYAKQVKDSKMSLEEAQDKAKETVKNLRYGGEEYFYIIDMDARMVMHPNKPEMDGKDQSDYKDPNGKKIFVVMADVARRDGAGFVDYEWPKPGSDKPISKVSYVRLFEDWKWIVGSGIYIDDVQKQMGMVAKLFVVIVAVFLLIVLPAFYYIIRKIIVIPIRKISGYAERIAGDDISVDINVLETQDEIGDLSRVFYKMQQYLKNMARLAEKIVSGDLSENVEVVITNGHKGDLTSAFDKMINTLRALLVETDKLVVATQEGKLDTRGNAKVFAGSWGTLVGGINNLIDTLVGHLDAMPSPVMLIDKEFNILYMNKNGTDLLSTTQKQIIGTKCYDNFKTSDCKTENCACAMAMQQGQKISRETDAHPRGMNLDIFYTAIPLKDEKNQVIGAMELVVDQTAIMNAGRVAAKQARYQDKETAKLLVNIEDLAQGKLQCSSKIEPTDEDTKAIGEMFSNIYKSYEESLNAMSSYVIETAKVLTEMSKGNLDLDIKGDYKGDFVEIKSSTNLIIDSLNEVFSDMNNASGQVAGGSRQVSDSAQALSQGTTEQASSIEELTASMEEISTQTQLNATNATQANELALAAKEGAIKGNEQMKGMLKAMDDINEASGNISKIIKVIDEIAFQTNILALNAAVEAARAGQHGKGFAVVAEEVRNLAARSANAAKETTALIEGSIKKVEGGTKIASDTAAALNQIVEGVTKTANLVGEIATASNEQALGINQVNQGILQVSDVVQTNSATSEESAAASEELSSQAELLREQVSRFKLKKTTGSSYKGFEDLNPEVLRMLEDMVQKKKSSFDSMNQGYAEAAATSSKPKISLSDREFGKY